ncbi:coiled-coil domain-containing glutamate-rich protein 2 [Trichosurus vulpecula]|uniref:coiled-coil domain-containing glutamate-rich protein 2 n=1 Tax=Trichosurus vulpecula TaxID=9337 RepID=UPI00186B0936|nr:coiled-coil domain-containing glutamate-rich protein 2 [Trichosurus vulpecula]
MTQPGLGSLLLLLLLGLAGAAPLPKQEVTRCLEETLKDKLAREGPCTRLFQEDEQLTSLLQTLEELRHQEISKHHLGPESQAEREEQEVEEEDFRKKKRGPGEVEGEKRLGQEVREEEEVKAKEQEVKGQARVQEEEEEDKKRRGPAEAWVSEESLDDLRKRRAEGAQGSEDEAGAWGRGQGQSWGQGVEKRVAEKASDEETAQFEEEEKGVRVSGGGYSLWQGAGPAHRHHHHQPHPEQESEEEEEEAEKKEQHELERLEQMGEELKRATEALGRRG